MATMYSFNSDLPSEARDQEQQGYIRNLAIAAANIQRKTRRAARAGAMALVALPILLAPPNASAASPTFKTAKEACPSNSTFVVPQKDGTFKSGGCTCYVASKISIPWSGQAGAWYGIASRTAGWATSDQQPRSGAVVGFNYGHVAYVDSVTQTGNTTRRVIKTDRVQTGSRSEKFISGYKDEWKLQNWKWVKVKVPVYGTRKVPTFREIQTVEVTQTYTVNTSQQDYDQGSGIRRTSWTATKTWTERDGALSVMKWNTPRTGAASGLQGYMFRT